MQAFERLYRIGGRWEDYTNYGILLDFKDSIGNIFPLHIDTWYFDNAIAPLGHMELSEIATVDHPDLWAFLAEQIKNFAEAFSPFIHLHTDAWLSYRLPGQGRRIGSLNVSIAHLADVTEQVPAANVTGVIIRLDVLVTVRGPDKYIGDIWLKNVGDLQLSGDVSQTVSQYSGNSVNATGRAALQLDVASLFLPDNQATLTEAREEWRRLRAIDPTVTIGLREDSPALAVVTLVEPPPSTPPNNQELYEENEPRLAQAINAWTARTGYPFVWEIRDI